MSKVQGLALLLGEVLALALCHATALERFHIARAGETRVLGFSL